MTLGRTLFNLFGFNRQPNTLKRKPSDSNLDKRPAKRTLTTSDIPLDSGLKKPKAHDTIFVLPNETIHHICTLVEDEDLRNLLLVKRAMASIVSPIYTLRHGIRKDAGLFTISIQGESFRALGAWKRSRLFPSSKQSIQLYCAINYEDYQLAAAQVHCLFTFLSTEFPTTPFSSIVINGVNYLNQAAILDFVRLIDMVGCRCATMISPPGVYQPRTTGTASHCPSIELLNLTRLALDTSHLVDQEWSDVLRNLTGTKLVALSVRGPPPFISLFRFMLRHPTLEALEAHCRWSGTPDRVTFGIPQRIVQMPHLERLNGPPCHLQAILRSLSHVPKALSLQFRPERNQCYPQFISQVVETVRLCDEIDSKLDISIHFRERHFQSEYEYKFDVRNVLPKKVHFSGTKTLCLFLPSMEEKDVEDICAQWFTIWPVLAGIRLRVSPACPEFTVDLAESRRGWATSAFQGGKVVIKWENEDNAASNDNNN